jgi:hypothetical protein
MAQVPILSGIYTDGGPDMRLAYPVNLVPTPTDSGISAGYLRPADGLVETGTGPGVCRGGIEWDGVVYRVMGTKLVTVDNLGNVVTIGDVGGASTASMVYSFDHLAIASDGQLWLYDGTTLAQNVDADLGRAIDVVWLDGYFVTTDGEFIVVTELTDPFAVNPLKYGSAEINPDPIVGLEVLRNELYALGRYTIEVFDNVGGDGFPLQRIEGAHIPKGCIGTHAKAVFMDALAFVGGGNNEAPGVYMAASGTATKISTVEIDRILASYTEAQLALTVVEVRNDNAHQHLYIHLPDRTLVFDGTASQAFSAAVWFVLTSSTTGFAAYRGRHFVWAYNRWQVADPVSFSVGYMDQRTSHHWGAQVRWEFSTGLIYNEGRGAILHELEVVALTGRVDVGDDPRVSTSYTLDGQTWSQDRYVDAGRTGDTLKRLRWMRNGTLRNWRGQRFRGTSMAHASFARLEARLEPLEF